LSENRSLTAKLTFPHPIAEHDDGRRTAAIVIRRERSPEQRSRAKHIEQVAGRPNDGKRLVRVAVGSYRRLHGGRNGSETTERTCAISSVTIFRIAGLDSGLRARQSSSDEHETVSLHKGEWA
jgi:hypothetical protein